jgi:hypothetical protein
VERIVNGGSFAQKLRVRDHIELVRLDAVLLDNPSHAVACADGHGGLVDDDFVAIQRASNLGGDGVHILQVGFARIGWRRADTDENDFRIAHCMCQVGCRTQTPLFQVALQQLVQPRLVDGRLSFVDGVHFRGVDVHTQHFVAQIGEHDARD